MLRLGLTGGIGSGKTTVAGFLRNRGAAVIDADAISRQMTAAGGLAIDPIRQSFGADYIAPDGALDRARMRQASSTTWPTIPAKRATSTPNIRSGC